jgi:hypothetical protein
MTAEPSNGGMLTSWKEIARFFDRDVRTVQRWEKDEGLPIHRHRHQRQSSVYAHPQELDAWWQQRGGRLSAPGVFSSAPREISEAIQVGAPASVNANAEGLPSTTARPAGWTSGLRRVPIAGVGVAVTGALGIIGIVLIGIVRAIPARQSGAESPYVWATLDGSRTHGELSTAPFGDLNGDGRSDMVVASQATRELHLLFGGSIPASGKLASTANVTIRGTENGAYQSLSVADLDGDGMRDLVVSVLLSEPDSLSATGSAYLLRGRRTWPRSLQLPEAADVTFGFRQPKDIRMAACPSISPTDLNQDGMEDLVLGGADFSPPGRASAGGVFVLFGRRAWPPEIDVERDADVTIHGSRTGEGLTGGCGMGDFNGDGRTDLALLAGEFTLWNLLGSRGRYFMFFGREVWPRVLTADRDADLRIDGERPDVGSFAPVLADLNGDGFDDLFVGSTSSTNQPAATRFAVFFGAARARSGVHGMSAADVVIDGDSESATQRPLIGTADLDGDGMDDVILANAAPGRVHVLFGRSRWPPRGRLARFDPVELFRGEPVVGRASLGLGDLDEDGLPDLVVTSAMAMESGERLWLLRPHRPIELDVRPGYEPNVLYLPGVLVAKVAGTGLAADDPLESGSVRLAGVAPTRTEWRDVDQDGTIDLLAYFDTQGMRVTPATTRVSLTARTRSGRLVAGHDSVMVMAGTADQLSIPGQTHGAQPVTRRR